MYMYMYIHIYYCLYIDTSLSLSLYICIYIYIYTYIHTYINTYTYQQRAGESACDPRGDATHKASMYRSTETGIIVYNHNCKGIVIKVAFVNIKETFFTNGTLLCRRSERGRYLFSSGWQCAIIGVPWCMILCIRNNTVLNNGCRYVFMMNGIMIL